MQRREFITFLGGAAAWPLTARAQKSDRMRRVGVLIASAQDDTRAEKYLKALKGALDPLGWVEGRNVQIDYRLAVDVSGMQSRAAELISLGPDVIVTNPTPATNAVRQATSSVPIVFTAVSDPIGARFVESFARPGGNITGFTNFEAAMGGKWLELLREIAPSIKRVSMLFNPETANAGASGGLYLQSLESGARVLGVELIVSPVHDPADIDGVFAAIARSPGGGLIVMPNVFTVTNRERIVVQAARYQIPTVYPQTPFVQAGGLLSYGVDVPDLFRRAASYVDRILKGEKPANLPVQAPTKFELAINLKTAKAIGLAIPPALLTRADEVIE
jgi:putative tryptophan/tyrosine transport system substrate-binding protein